jgi:hypothetical protein
MFCHLVYHLGLLCLWLSTVALAQRECDLDGATSTYNLGELIIPFDNLCGRDIGAALDYYSSAEQRRSDCIDRCVKQAPLCYGFDYTPYVSSTSNNCWLMNGSFSTSSAKVQNYVVDAGMLNPDFLAKLPEDCKTKGLRGCLEGGLATPTASLSSSATSGVSTTSPSTGGDRQETSGGLSTGAKAGIGAGVGLAALIAILCGVLFILERVKRKRATAPSAMVQQSNTGDVYPSHKAGSQIHAYVATGGLELAEPRPGMPAAEQVHEIDGRARHET